MIGPVTIDAGGGHTAAVPCSSHAHSLWQRYPGFVAQFLPCLVDCNSVVRAVERHAETSDEGMLVSCHLGDTLGGKRSTVEKPVGDMNAGHPRSQFIGDCPQEFLLRRRSVVSDVVDLAHCPIPLKHQKQSLHDVIDIGKGHSIAPRADHDALACQQAVRDAPEIQIVARAEYRPGTDNRCGKLACCDQALNQDVARRLSARIRIGQWRQGEVLMYRRSKSLLVHAGGTEVHKAVYSGCERSTAHILSPRHIHCVIVFHRAPYAYRCRQMKYSTYPTHRRHECVRLTDITSVNRNTPFPQPG